MSNLKGSVVGITIGIRYARSFRVPDISGEIIDHILYDSKTPFGVKFFPNVQENSSREKTLFNGRTGEYIRINTDDLILAIQVDGDFDKKMKWISEKVIPYFEEELFRVYKIKNIKRLGIVFSHKISKNKELSDAIAAFTDDSVSNPDNISISFSRKSAVKEALFRRDTSDYRNKIYNFRELEESVQADLDCQYYYEPLIEDLRNCFVNKVLSEASEFLGNNFYKWLEKYEKKTSK
ncbi:hypothetical protein ACFL2R_03715 [Patescibacteria group bacterium]